MFGDLDYDPSYAYEAGEHPKLLLLLLLLRCQHCIVKSLRACSDLLSCCNLPAVCPDTLH
jgi:hypothetical protein